MAAGDPRCARAPAGGPAGARGRHRLWRRLGEHRHRAGLSRRYGSTASTSTRRPSRWRRPMHATLAWPTESTFPSATPPRLRPAEATIGCSFPSATPPRLRRAEATIGCSFPSATPPRLRPRAGHDRVQFSERNAAEAAPGGGHDRVQFSERNAADAGVRRRLRPGAGVRVHPRHGRSGRARCGRCARWPASQAR